MPHDEAIWDCLIIGGGPAGLTAAIYLARFRRQVLVVDAGQSRAELIPESHNYPGFEDGVSGPMLLQKLREQATNYGAQLRTGKVDTLTGTADAFSAKVGGETLRAKRVLLGTGIIDESPPMPGLKDAIYDGALRYCPICDAYETTDQRIGVIGSIHSAHKKAIFMRTYSRNVTLFHTDEITGADDEIKELKDAGVTLHPETAVDVSRDGDRVEIVLGSGKRVAVDTLYPSMGCNVRSQLATALGAECDDVGCLRVNDKQQTAVKGLYAAGDVVTDLHQIAVATGHAAIAATCIHNSLEHNFR